MKIYPRSIKTVLLLLTSAYLAGCSYIPGADKVLPDRKVEYKKSKQVGDNLEIPPDLSRSSIGDELVIPGAASDGASLSGFQKEQPVTGRVAARSEVLPEVEDIEVMRDEDQRWLLIQAEPENVWYRVVEFWQENGILLEEQDPTVGVMVTDWLENTADVSNDFVTDAIRSFAGGLYSATTRDQFRVRVEDGAQLGTTELYLTHRGMEESIIQDGQGSVERTVWNPRETDRGLEAEMLRRLMVYLGVEDQRASRSLAAAQGKDRKPRSKLNKAAGNISLIVDENFGRSWRLVGVALDRVGFAVEDRNRDGGAYYVRYNDPMKNAQEKGWLSKLAFWQGDDDIDKENQYQVKLSSTGESTEVTVLNDSGARDNSETALRILTLLNEQIR